MSTTIATQPQTVSTSQIYIPTGAKPIVEISRPPIRLLLQGFSGTGKSTSAVTFPNPVILDLDNNLGGIERRPDIHVVECWRKEWITEYSKGKPAMEKPEVIFHWIKNEGSKLTSQQTLVLDSWTDLQNWFDTTIGAKKYYTKKGTENEFMKWELKGQFSLDVCTELKTLKCNVVVICHETVDRDEDGKLTGKVKPLMKGYFSDELAKNFTDYYRQVVKEDDKKNPTYLWQVRGDNKCNCKNTTIRNLKLETVTVPAHYNSFGIVTNNLPQQ